MYRRLCYTIILLVIYSTSSGQLSISLQEAPAGVVQKQQLWNLTLIYTGNSPITVTIGLSLIDVKDNQPVLTAFTRSIALSRGVKQLRLTEVSPVDYNYFSPALVRLSETFLPIGNYRACYTIYDGSKNAASILAEDCIGLVVEPISPPQLALPADSAILSRPHPQFSWLPPAPHLLFNDLNYDLLLVEVREDQTAYAAIQENLPVYQVLRLTNPFNNYPLSARNLDTGKVYAWRVMAKDGETYAAPSEVWTFKIVPENPDKILPAGGMYLELKNEQAFARTGILPNNVLGIKYYSYDQSHESIVKFFNDKGELVKEVRKTVAYGDNFWIFKLDQSFSNDITYFVEVNDLQSARYRTSFRITK